MSDGSLALSTMPPGLPADADYDALCQALMASARGRWFLEEYAKRNRNADTGVVLDAIARVEAVVRGEQANRATQGMRIELLEMARTIAQTRADVAEAKPAPASAETATDIFAVAGRLQDVAWTMRERGLDMAMCDQIADLSCAILSASSLRNPNDGRAQKLGEVLRSLERRIDAMLSSACEPPASDGSGGADRAAPEHTHRAAMALLPEAAPSPVATTRVTTSPVTTSPVVADEVEPDKQAALETTAPLPVAALPFPAVAEPEAAPASTATPATDSEPAQIDLDPIPVRPPPVAVAVSEPAPPPAPLQADAEADDFLLAPLPLPGMPVVDVAASTLPATDPLAALRALSPEERIALFT